MKKDIHPEYRQTTIRCHCGHELQAGSTKENISVEICSQCHPFYTGKQKLVDSAGRIERFHRKYGKFMEGEKQQNKLEEKPEEKLEKKIVEKVEEKPEKKVEEKPEKKIEEKPEKKIEEKTEKKIEKKTKKKQEEKTE